MEILIGSVITKILAAILALFMPLSAAGPAIAEAARAQTTIIVPAVEYHYDEGNGEELEEGTDDEPSEEAPVDEEEEG